MKVNIVGRGEGWEGGYESEGRKWAINYWHPSADTLFDVHMDAELSNLREWKNAATAGCSLYNRANFPYRGLMGIFDTDYFASSVDWLIAFAIYNGADDIHLWGITLDDVGDHYELRCCTDYWCGRAAGIGVKVTVHGNSTIMTTGDGNVYGLGESMVRRYEKPV